MGSSCKPRNQATIDAVETHVSSRRQIQENTHCWEGYGISLLGSKMCFVAEFLEYGNTVNAELYCSYLLKLRRVIQNWQRGLLTHGVLFLQDNATPHTTKVTKKLLEQFRWEVLSHPPHSPDLTQSDFHLFLHLKNHLAGKISAITMKWSKKLQISSTHVSGSVLWCWYQ